MIWIIGFALIFIGFNFYYNYEEKKDQACIDRHFAAVDKMNDDYKQLLKENKELQLENSYICRSYRKLYCYVPNVKAYAEMYNLTEDIIEQEII